MFVAVLQVSVPNSGTVLMFVLMVVNLKLVEGCFEFYMRFNFRNAVLAFPILVFTSALDPPSSSMILTRYVNVSISLRVSPLNVIWFVLSVPYFELFLYLSCMWRPSAAGTATTLVVLICIYWCDGIEELGHIRSRNRLVASNLSIVLRASVRCGVLHNPVTYQEKEKVSSFVWNRSLLIMHLSWR